MSNRYDVRQKLKNPLMAWQISLGHIILAASTDHQGIELQDRIQLRGAAEKVMRYDVIPSQSGFVGKGLALFGESRVVPVTGLE